MSNNTPGKPPAEKEKLSIAKRAELLALYETGHFSQQELADRYGVSKSTIHRIIKSAGMPNHSAAAPANPAADIMKKQLQEKQLQQAQAVADRIYKTNESHYALSELLGKLIGVELAGVAQNHKTLADIGPAMKAAQAASLALRTVREERYAVLGLDAKKDTDDELPELIVRELTPEQVKQMREMSKEADLGVGMDELDEIPDATDPNDPSAELDDLTGVVVPNDEDDDDDVVEEGGDA